MQGGILLGPSALGRSSKFLNTVFPKQSLTVLNTIANIGLLFFLFLVGLELNLRAIALALADISLPFVLDLSGSGSPLVSLWVFLCSDAFVLFAAFVLRPVLAWMARRSLEGEPVKETYICATLVLVLASSFITDTIGIHTLFSAFVVGDEASSPDGR